jgi:AcrR family transcriptional regulator
LPDSSQPAPGDAASTADPAATPDSTLAALLDAGLRLFSQHGYDAASVRAITTAAGANLGAITYHFGSKQAFYEAVVATALLPFAHAVEEAARGASPPLDRVEAVVHTYFEQMAARPELPRLMMQQIGAGKVPPPAAAAALRRVLGTLAALAGEGQADGSIRTGDPLLLALSIVAQPVHLTVARPLLTSFVGIDPFEPGTRQRLAAHAAAFVRAGLAEREET